MRAVAPAWLQGGWEWAGMACRAAPVYGRLSAQALAPALGSPAIRAVCGDGNDHLQSQRFPRNAQDQWLLHA